MWCCCSGDVVVIFRWWWWWDMLWLKCRSLLVNMVNVCDFLPTLCIVTQSPTPLIHNTHHCCTLPKTLPTTICNTHNTYRPHPQHLPLHHNTHNTYHYYTPIPQHSPHSACIEVVGKVDSLVKVLGDDACSQSVGGVV